VLGLSGEVAMVAPLFRMSSAEIKYRSDGGSPPPSGGRSPWIYRLTGFFERDLRHYLSTMQTYLMFAALPPPESLEVVELVPEINKKAERRYYILSSLFLPALSKGSIRDARATAHIRLTMTALAVEEFRTTGSHLPELLAELVPTYLDSVPIDPFDGQPLRYRKLDPGYVVYSIGQDGQDDGGRESPQRIKSTDTNSYDLTFTVDR